MKIQDAIAQSINQNEIVRCEFAGDVGDLAAWLNDNVANGCDAAISEESDGSIDVDDIDGNWRIRVTLTEAS